MLVKPTMDNCFSTNQEGSCTYQTTVESNFQLQQVWLSKMYCWSIVQHDVWTNQLSKNRRIEFYDKIFVV